MEDDWDLHAVVRSCTATTAMTNSSSSCFGPDFRPQSCFSSSYGREHVGHRLSLPVPDPFETRSSGNGFGDLEELYKPFFRKSSEPVVRSPRGVPVSPLTPLFSVSHEQPMSFQSKQQAQQQQPPKQSRPSVTSSATSHAPRSKKRKNQLKKVCQVPADALSSDVWAWRKYGQKPIKGSPFPRGYYRCSSSKGCIARKQVERNKSDPGMFTVTYTGEHNHPAPTHRNSLAGSSRQKTVSPQTVAAADDSNDPSPSKPTCSSPATSLAEDELLLPQSTNTESREDIDFLEDEEEDELCGFSEMAAASNEFFAGLEEELAGSIAGDRFSDRFAPRFGHPWLANNAATAAGGF